MFAVKMKMAIQSAIAIQPFLLLLLTSDTFAYSYPNSGQVYGTKRYGRSSHRLRSYEPYTYQTPVRYPVSYYKMYPYGDTYVEDYYYPAQESYPLYYPRSSKYEVYQAVMPYYYQETPYTAGYDYDPTVELQEEIQDAEREEREEAQPIGHESFYENDGDNNQDTNIADVNAAFLQNLILSQMYQDSLTKDKQNYNNGYNDYEDTYEQRIAKPTYQEKQKSFEDEDVKELKQLTKQKNRQLRKQGKKGNDLHWSQKQEKSNRRKQQQKQENKRSETNDLDEEWDPYQDAVVYTDRKAAIMKEVDPTAEAATTQESNAHEPRGQKEEFQMRPATPVRHPFAAPVLTMLSNREESKRRAPSVYDTIKHMLDMEKNLENNNQASNIRPTMKKRIITPEDSLTKQLTVLKKAQ